MSEPTPEPTPQPSPVPAPQPPPPPAPAAEPTPQPSPISREEYEAAVAELARLREAETARQRAEMSEAERLRAELEDKNRELAQRADEVHQARVRLIAGRLGFADEEDAYLNIRDTTAAGDTEAKIEAALKAVLDRKPHLKKPAGAMPGNPANPPRKEGPPATFDPKNPPRLTAVPWKK